MKNELPQVSTMKVLLWNTEWSPSEFRRSFARSLIKNEDPDLICITEGMESVLAGLPNVICSSEDFGYSSEVGKRKVWLSTRSGWSHVELIGSKDLPAGRFVSGVTNGIRVIGVCIPWRSAHVSSGHRNREPWEDHLKYLQSLGDILRRYEKDQLPICLLGDFNQRIPSKSKVFQQLSAAISPRLEVRTAGVTDVDGKPLIDHVATSAGLEFRLDRTLGRKAEDGTHISDHPALIVTLERELSTDFTLRCKQG